MRIMVIVKTNEDQATDLAGLLTPGDLATPRDGERGTLGVA